MNDSDKLNKLVQSIFVTQPQEIQCEQAAIEMVRAIQTPLLADELAQRYPQLSHHLKLCLDCAAEYVMLRELRVAAGAGDLTHFAHIPPPPSDEPSFFEQLQNAITAVFSGFTPPTPAALTRSASLALEPVDVLLDNGRFILTIDADISEQEPSLRNLFITVTPLADVTLEGITVLLLHSDSRHIIAETTLDPLGDGAFLTVAPGSYELFWQAENAAYLVKDVVIP